MPDMTALLLCLLLLCVSHVTCKTFRDGEYVATARKSQYHQLRTEWHDLLGRHCPRFGEDSTVVMPLPQPTKWEVSDEYKLMLSFDSERLQTVWLPLIKRAAPNVPQLTVRFTAVGAELRSVSVQVGSLQPRYLKRHVTLVEEWKDATKWPKHLVVEYEWERLQDENVEGGVFVLLTSSFAAFSIVLVLAKLKFGSKVDASLYELVSSLDDVAAPSAPVATARPSISEPPPGGDGVPVSGPHAQHRAAKPPLPNKAGSHVD